MFMLAEVEVEFMRLQETVDLAAPAEAVMVNLETLTGIMQPDTEVAVAQQDVWEERGIPSTWAEPEAPAS